MKKLILLLLFLSISSTAFAQWGKDAWGHRTKQENYWKDRDGDGVPNYYDRRDDNRDIY